MDDTITGTSYFVDRNAAVQYYADQGIDAAGVDAKLIAGEIHLGRPPYKHENGELIVKIDGGLRYAIRRFELQHPTRADYMAGRCTHAEFYRAVCKTARIKITDESLLARVRRALASGDQHLNSIGLSYWDSLAARAQRSIAEALRRHGDFYSMAGGVCAMKQAARQAVESSDG